MLKGPDRLVDWGIKECRGDKNSECLEEIERLIDRYRPDMIAVEDYTARGSRRCGRVRELIFEVLKLATRRKIKIKTVSRINIQKAFSEGGARTKHEIATAIATRFPELGPYLPPERKCYMSEDPRMSVFDAVVLGLAFYEKIPVTTLKQ
ncbi:crossover junction endodeoxyribonuclease RuvC [Candidatus Manganitrophus noduliformans]|uniref:Crossover junction endodeoxyribonuclease RuvC n=1 Tax=Candidatus Manganitrophus noduliformans TaxID=2606439 RepID=A0A7X6DT94_9BACT|nr:crossover junction endodeoxyribonuclease RuvC [Candidatus Manganitrophus noduliformans]NKE72965.1 crossover junction endodeoxyribonuclease RuvC [Candidatus Manganitrophus noduliformans]